MRFIRFNSPASGPRLGYLRDDKTVIDLTGASKGSFLSFLDLLIKKEEIQSSLTSVVESILENAAVENELNYSDLASLPIASQSEHLLLPIIPPEVWAAGVTYKRSVEARMEESQVQDVYDRVYSAERPEIFFKSTADRVVGYGEKIGLRKDSKCIVPEPELGVVLGINLEIVGYIIGNDLTSRDIEGENPLYLPQAKIFRNSCALGPIIASCEAVSNPYDLEIICDIIRDNKTVFSDKASTGKLNRKIEDLVAFLGRDNPIFPGTVLLTGTCIVPPDSFSLIPGDTVKIAIEPMGVLANEVG